MLSRLNTEKLHIARDFIMTRYAGFRECIALCKDVRVTHEMHSVHLFDNIELLYESHATIHYSDSCSGEPAHRKNKEIHRKYKTSSFSSRSITPAKTSETSLKF